MQIETIGNYQLHLSAQPMPGSGNWDPFFEIYKFDEDAQDFKCVFERHRASEQTFSRYGDAIDEARRAGNAVMEKEHWER